TNQNDGCGVHSTSGVPNRAVALAVKSLGWEKMGKLTYAVMTHRLRSTSDFRDFATQMLAECKATLSGSECSEIRSAFQAVGAI
ncbi:MAG: M4 family metallopeptidase, partial [Bdellovibrionota bacterium]